MQFYVIYKDNKLGLTLVRPPLVRRRLSAEVYREGAIYCRNYPSSHARMETDNYIFPPSGHELCLGPSHPYSWNVSLVILALSARESEKRDIICVSRDACVTSIREKDRGKRTSEMMGGKKCRCAKEENGRRTQKKKRERGKGGEEDKLHGRRGFIRARYVTVIRV